MKRIIGLFIYITGLTTSLLMSAAPVMAQETLVVGTIRDIADKLPIPSVNIYFEGTTVGTQSDEDGFFSIRHTGPETRMIFSCVGYKTRTVRIKPGEVNGVDLFMVEDINLLDELFVLPGANPAIDLMAKVRASRSRNDIYNSDRILNCNEYDWVMLRDGSYMSDSRLLRSLSEGMLTAADSSRFLPLFSSEKKLLRQKESSREISSKSISSPENLRIMMEKLTGDFRYDLNFYRNSISLFGKNFISPLSSVANSYYNFFLIDSVGTPAGKQYLLNFKSKNRKNLAFNGSLKIDSASLALTEISADLPVQANLNYIHNLQIRKKYSGADPEYWVPESEELSMTMTYGALADSANLSPEIIIRKVVMISPSDSSGVIVAAENDQKPFRDEDIERSMAEINNTPLFKTAKWLADVVLTGYMQVGKIDVGKIYQFARVTDIEGLRLNVPLRTNQYLWKNFSIGGYWGYGLRNKRHNYGADVAWKLPIRNKLVLGAGFIDDYRRIDYNYNDFYLEENPLISLDEDIGNTVFSFRSSARTSLRKEFYGSLSYDWNPGVESSLYFRSVRYDGNEALPFYRNGSAIQSISHQFVSLNTRISFDERTYEDHLDRIYVRNYNPVFYLTLEGGRTRIYGQENDYLKAVVSMKHRMLFGIGQWNYRIDAGWLAGNVPYNLLFIPVGSKSIFFDLYHYSLMNYMEYACDKYIDMQNEVILNGVILNKLPLIRRLNLREMLSLKMLYGGIDADRTSLIDFPEQIRFPDKPYVEIGAGVTNILRVFSLQSIWRLTDREQPGISTWGIRASVRVDF